MFRVLCVILLISVSEGSFDLPSNVRALLSEDFNVTAGELIVAGEAEKLNLTAKEHLAYCAGTVAAFLFSPEEKLSMKDEKCSPRQMKVESSDDVIFYLKEHCPNTYKKMMQLNQVFEKKMDDNLDRDTWEYVQFVRYTMLVNMVEYSHFERGLKTANETSAKFRSDMATLLHKFKLLPQEAKDSIERGFCAQTLVRIATRKMHLLLGLLILSSFAEGAFDLPPNVRALLSYDFNVTAGEIIVEEEAVKLNLTAKMHVEMCSRNIGAFVFNLEETRSINAERCPHLSAANSTNEFMSRISQCPALHGAFSRRLQIFRIKLEKLENNEKQWANETAEALFHTWFTFLQMLSGSIDELEVSQRIAVIWPTVYHHFKQLPGGSKDAIERAFCIQTAARIVQEDRMITDYSVRQLFINYVVEQEKWLARNSTDV